MKKILLPEGGDERILQAAAEVARRGAAQPLLLGAPRKLGGKEINGVEFISPDSSALARCAETLQKQYAPKRELTAQQAEELANDPLHQAAAMLVDGLADGVVAGAVATTAEVVRAALRVVKCRPEIKTLSGFFFLPKQKLLLADCALVEEPTEAQLLDIARATADSAKKILSAPPVVALLSFSTAGSSQHPAAQKIARVANKLREECPQLQIAGEIQADAALDIAVAQKKGITLPAPANVLIFPDLNAGNIGYKLIQRLTNSVAVGPVLQGLTKPFNDLSRGATPPDITAMIELTAKQAE